MQSLRICVLDMRHNAQEPDTLSRFDTSCVAYRIQKGDDIYSALATQPFDAFIFEYDWPDIPSLLLIKEAKFTQPSVPIVMITREHSEELAVWALRTGLWDYFVTPVQDSELRHCLEALAAIPRTERRDEPREVIKPSGALPREVRFRKAKEPAVKTTRTTATEYIERNMSRKITQAGAASECGMSPWQFSRHFKKHFGMTFQDYVQQRRIEEAKRLLKNPSSSVTDVCFSVGFEDPSYFSRIFRRVNGISPSSYKRQLDLA